MRRRGLEPPPGYPGPGPQPCRPGVRCVRIAPERPMRPGSRTIRTGRTIWMLPRMLPRPVEATDAVVRAADAGTGRPANVVGEQAWVVVGAGDWASAVVPLRPPPEKRADCRFAWIRAVSEPLLLFHGCRGGTGYDRAPTDARTSSKASTSGTAARARSFTNAGSRCRAPPGKGILGRIAETEVCCVSSTSALRAAKLSGAVAVAVARVESGSARLLDLWVGNGLLARLAALAR